MKSTKRFFLSLALATVMLAGQTVSPFVQTAEAARPFALFTEETGDPAPSGQIVCTPPELYAGMKTVPELTLKMPEGASVPEDLSWEVSVPGGAQATGVKVVKTELQGQIHWQLQNITKAEKITLTASSGGTALAGSTLEIKEQLTPALGDFDLAFPQNVVYDGKPKTVEAKPKQGITGMGNVTVLYGDSDKAPANAGEYSITLAVAESDKYKGVSIDAGKLTIAKAPLTEPQAAETISVPQNTPHETVETLTLTGGGIAQGEELKAECRITLPDTSKAGEYTAQGEIVKLLDSENYTFDQAKVKVNYVVTPVERAITKLEVKLQPKKLSYIEGEKLDLSGLVLSAFYGDGSAEEITPEQFAQAALTAFPANGAVLSAGDGGKPVTISLKGGKVTAATANLNVQPIAKAVLGLSAAADPASGRAGEKVTLTVALSDPSGSKKPFPAADKITITNDAGLTPEKAVPSGKDGTFTMEYTLPEMEGAVTFTILVEESEYYAAASTTCKVEAAGAKAVPELSIRPDAAVKRAGEEVTLTVSLGNPKNSGEPFPEGKELKLSNNGGLKDPVLTGKDGTYTAKYTLPKKEKTITFTVSFAGNENFEAAKDASCAVQGAELLTTPSAINKALRNLPAAGKITDENRETVKSQTSILLDSVKALSAANKNRLEKEAVSRLDAVLEAVTGSELKETAVTNSNVSSASRIPEGGVLIVGAVSAADVSEKDTVQLVMTQLRTSGSQETLKFELELRKNSKKVTLQTPVWLEIDLPENFQRKSNMVLRHTNGSKLVENITPEINGSRGNYTMRFRTSGFSTFTLLWRGQTSNSGADKGTLEEYTITATAGNGGIISPSGKVKVKTGTDQTFVVRAVSGYQVDRVLVDGTREVSLRGDSYTFEQVEEPFSIEVTFKRTAQSSASSAPASSGTAGQGGTSSGGQRVPVVPASSGSGNTTASRGNTSSESVSSRETASTAPPVSSQDLSSEESREELPSEFLSSEENVSEPQDSSGPLLPEEPVSSDSGGMSNTDLTVAVVIIIVVVSLSLAAIFFGIYLNRRRDEEDDDYDEEEE